MINGAAHRRLAPSVPVPTRVKLITLCVRMALYSTRSSIVRITSAVSPQGVYGWAVQTRPSFTIGEGPR